MTEVTHDMIRNPHRNPINIRKSPTADTRSCDSKEVTRLQLGKSSFRHIEDVDCALSFLEKELCNRGHHASANGGNHGIYHDHDKLSDLDGFHRDFVAANDRPFIEGEWYKNHLKANRHHIDKPEGVPEDINLIDVLEHIADVVMAGMARTGEVYPVNLSHKILQKAVDNTVELLKQNTVVK